jgi:hypothetical protein
MNPYTMRQSRQIRPRKSRTWKPWKEEENMGEYSMFFNGYGKERYVNPARLEIKAKMELLMLSSKKKYRRLMNKLYNQKGKLKGETR